MQCKQADPAGYMDGILVRMVTVFRYLVRDIVNRNDSVKQRNTGENQDTQSKIIKHNDLSKTRWLDLQT